MRPRGDSHAAVSVGFQATKSSFRPVDVVNGRNEEFPLGSGIRGGIFVKKSRDGVAMLVRIRVPWSLVRRWPDNDFGFRRARIVFRRTESSTEGDLRKSNASRTSPPKKDGHEGESSSPFHRIPSKIAGASDRRIAVVLGADISTGPYSVFPRSNGVRTGAFS